MPIAIHPSQASSHSHTNINEYEASLQSTLDVRPLASPVQMSLQSDLQSTEIPTTSTPSNESTLPPPNLTALPIAPNPPISYDFTRDYGSSAIDDDDEEDERGEPSRQEQGEHQPESAQQQSHLDGFRNNLGRRNTWTRTMLPGRRSLSSSSSGSGIQGLRSFAMTQMNPDTTSQASSPSVSRHASISSIDQTSSPNVNLPTNSTISAESNNQLNTITMQPRPPTPPRRNSINGTNTRSRSLSHSSTQRQGESNAANRAEQVDQRIRSINSTVSLLRRMLGVDDNQDDEIAAQALQSMERWIQDRLARAGVTNEDALAQALSDPPEADPDATEIPSSDETEMMEGVVLGDPATQGLDADGNPIESEVVQVDEAEDLNNTQGPTSPPTSISLPPPPDFGQFTLATPFYNVGALPPLTPQSEKPPAADTTTSTSSSGSSTPSAIAGARMTLERGYYSRMERMERRHRRDDESDCGGGGGGGGGNSGFGSVIAGR